MKNVNLILFVLCLAWFTNCTQYSNIPRKLTLFGNNKISEKSDSNKTEHANKSVLIESIEIKAKKILPFFNNSNSILAHFDKKLIYQNPLKLKQPITASNHNKTLNLNKIPQENIASDSLNAIKNDKKFSNLSAIAGGLALFDTYLLIEFFYHAVLSEFLIVTLVFGIITLIVSIVALTSTRKLKDQYKNRYMAKVGLVMGITTIFLVIVGFLLMLIFLFSL
jgi:hypothetical protein